MTKNYYVFCNTSIDTLFKKIALSLYCCLCSWLILIAQPACLQPSRVEVLPVFFVPNGVAFPDYAAQRNNIEKHLEWSQNRFREMLGGRTTFAIADTPAIAFQGSRPDAYYKSFEDRGAAAYLEEILPSFGYTRFNCPYVILVIYIDYNYNFPLGGGRTLNGGCNSGGGVVIMSGADLKWSPIFQSTLQHELGHGFNLPHVDSYGYNMQTNASIMSYNPSHQTNFFTPGTVPGILIPEDIRNLSLNKLAFPDLVFDSAADIPASYAIYPHIPLVGIMDIPGQYPYKIQVTSQSGETYSSAAGNLVQNEIKLSYPGMPFAYDAGNMWHSAEVDGWATVTIKFPIAVTINKLGIHTQHSGIYQKAEALRIEQYNGGDYQEFVIRSLPGVDEYFSFPARRDSIFRFSFLPGVSKMVTIRGIEFFNNNEPVFPPAVPYILRNPERKLLPSRPEPVSPANKLQQTAFQIRLRWRGERALSYKLEIDTCKDFCNPLLSAYLTDTSFLYHLPFKDRMYYWRVKGLNITGQGFGEWSRIMSFTQVSTGYYVFVGNGDYFNAANWLNNAIPPNPVLSGMLVDIKTTGNNNCIINNPVVFNSGAKLSIDRGSNLQILGGFIMQEVE